MKAGGGKAKGAEFERRICRLLSLWVSHRKKEDCFWRSAMSGGRATLGFRAGKNLSRQAGDVCSVSPEGHALTKHFYIELKHHRKLNLEQFFLCGQGPLARMWEVCCVEAERHDHEPMMIVKQNQRPELVITKPNEVAKICEWNRAPLDRVRLSMQSIISCDVHLLSQVLKQKFKGV